MAHVRVVERKGGKRAYEARWKEGTKFRQRVFSARRDAERFVARIEVELAAGNDIRPLTRTKLTVRDAVDAVLAAEQHRLKPRTFHSYQNIYAHRLDDRFGHRLLGSITREDVQAWISDLVNEGLAPPTVKHQYLALRKLFKWAIKERILAFDPGEHVSLPRFESSHEYPILTVNEIDRLARAMAETPPYGLLVRFMALTGLRVGETAGLRVRDVQLAKRRVLVRQTAQRIKGKGWVLGTPKSKRSTRAVPILDSTLIADLKAYLLTHPKSGQPEALFWPGRAPGSREADFERVVDGSTFLRNHFKPALTRAKLPKMRVHDLRHTAASLWLAAGFQPYEVSRWLGHANVSTTDAIYAHLYQTDYSDHLDRFEAYRDREQRRTS